MSYFASTEFIIEVGKGNIPGHRLETVNGQHEANVETTAYGDLSLIPSVVVLPNPGGIQLEVVSSDNTQDVVGGTGCKSIEIHYLDTSHDEQVETVILTGTTPVNTVAVDIQTVQYMHTKTVGTGGVALGNISLRNTAGSVTYEYIAAGGNQSLSSRWTVPNGKKAYLLGWHCSGLKKRIDLQLRATCDKYDRSLLAGIFLFQDSESCESSNSGELNGRGLRFPAECEIKISCIADGAGGEAAGGISLLIVDD